MHSGSLKVVTHTASLRYDVILQAIQQLQCERPYFLPPLCEKDRVERAPFSRVLQVGLLKVTMDARSCVTPCNYFQVELKQTPRWTLKDSIFVQRKRENESRDVFDTEQVRIPCCTEDPAGTARLLAGGMLHGNPVIRTNYAWVGMGAGR